MVKFCVFYYGKPEDPAAFDKYYWSHHLPIVARWPQIKRIVVSKGQPDDDIYQIAELYFDSRMEMETALSSRSARSRLRMPRICLGLTARSSAGSLKSPTT